MDRRQFLRLLLATLSGVAMNLRAGSSRADNDDGDSGDDDGGSDDHGDDDDDSGRGGSDARDGDDHVKARDAVREGKILPLREILKRVAAMNLGRVISIDLSLQGRSPFYTLKIQSAAGRVKTLRVDAVTGRKMSTFGWW